MWKNKNNILLNHLISKELKLFIYSSSSMYSNEVLNLPIILTYCFMQYFLQHLNFPLTSLDSIFHNSETLHNSTTILPQITLLMMQVWKILIHVHSRAVKCGWIKSKNLLSSLILNLEIVTPIMPLLIDWYQLFLLILLYFCKPIYPSILLYALLSLFKCFRLGPCSQLMIGLPVSLTRFKRIRKKLWMTPPTLYYHRFVCWFTLISQDSNTGA